METHTIQWGDHRLELGKNTCVMGVLNVTPDSFSDGGKYLSPQDAIAHGERLIEEGADILDIGGESTRPFSEAVSIEEETHRVVPVIEALAKRVQVPISIDTSKVEVARKALEAGASIINDISALRSEPDLADIAAQYGVPVILMHMKGTPKTMQISPVYKNLIEEIKSFLEERVLFATSKGIPRSRIIIDPGIGFGKTFDHNFQLIKHLRAFESLNLPILVGPSRKAFIRKTICKDDLSPEAPQVESGTQAAVAAAVLAGAHMVRVHDVANTRITLKIIDAIKNA
ncbi:MAG: dihydropteroate synthase [Deltaproteobacteria bacterium]|nr:dihydropteroate synthase [Deltaproteobacteria bacterium]MBW1994906.1 dihydropteroate synthase [Deltaproteobacteria bacterium]MBW2152112.1 dihydropteroate synthase [Deltaproteobacteria bacterium]